MTLKNTLHQNNTITAKQCFSQHVSPDLVDESRIRHDNDAQNLSMGPGKHGLSHSGVRMACFSVPTSSRPAIANLNMEISKSNFDFRGSIESAAARRQIHRLVVELQHFEKNMREPKKFQ